MLKMVLHVANWIGFYTSCGIAGKLSGNLFGRLFRRFLTDEAYAAEHPKKYLAGVAGICTVAIATTVALVWVPLKWIMDFIDSKIEEIPDKKDVEKIEEDE